MDSPVSNESASLSLPPPSSKIKNTKTPKKLDMSGKTTVVTGNVDSGATSHFFGENSLPSLDHVAKDMFPVTIRTAAKGSYLTSEWTGLLRLPQLPHKARRVRIFRGIVDNLISTGQVCDAGFEVVYNNQGVTIRREESKEVVLRGFRCPTTKRYLIDLTHSDDLPVRLPEPLVNVPSASVAVPPPTTLQNTVSWYHACLGSPAISTFSDAVRLGFVKLPGLTADAVNKYPPVMSLATPQGHLHHRRSGQRSTKKAKNTPILTQSTPADSSSPAAKEVPTELEHEAVYLCVLTYNESSIHLDNCGVFPKTSASGNRYMLIMYHMGTGYIHCELMTNRTGPIQAEAVNRGLKFFRDRGFAPKSARMDNETSPEVQAIFAENSISVEYVAPYHHQANSAERAIQTWKNHFLACLATANKRFDLRYWDLLVPYAEAILNILHPSRDPLVSAWEKLHREPFDFNALELCPPGCLISIHDAAAHRASWDAHCTQGFFLGFAPQHYRSARCLTIKGQIRVSDTIIAHHQHIILPEDRERTVREQLVEHLEKAAAALSVLVNDRNASTSLQDLQADTNAIPNAAILLRLLCPQDRNTVVSEVTTTIPAPGGQNQTDENTVIPPEVTSPETVSPPPNLPEHQDSLVPINKNVQGDEPTKKRGRRVHFQEEIDNVHDFRANSPPSEGVPKPVAEAGRQPEYRNPTTQGLKPRRSPREKTKPDLFKPQITGEPLPAKNTQNDTVQRVLAEVTAQSSNNAPAAENSRVDPLAQYYIDKDGNLLNPPPLAPDRTLGNTVEFGPDFQPILSKRQRKAARKQKLAPTVFMTDYVYSTSPVQADLYNLTVNDLTYAKAIRGPDREIWEKAADTELTKLIDVHQVMRFIRWQDMPRGRIASYYNPQVSEKVKNGVLQRRIRGVIGGNISDYSGQTSSSTASMESIKVLINSTLSKPGWKFMTADITDFYLGSPMERPEYMILTKAQIPPASREKYVSTIDWRNDKALVEITKGIYGLKQSGLLAQKRLHAHLQKYGYKQTNTPCIFTHETREIVFSAVVDDFGISYGNTSDCNHLLDALRDLYPITTDISGSKYVGLNLDWDWEKRTCRISMHGYIKKALTYFNVTKNSRGTHSPLPVKPVVYGRKGPQMAPLPDSSKPLDAAGKTRVQKVVGKLLFYARAVDPTLFPALGYIASQQATPTEKTNQDIAHILQYVANYPDVSILYSASSMQLRVSSDASYLSASKARSIAGGHFYFGSHEKDVLNGPVYVLSSIIPNVATSAFSAETAALYMNTEAINNLKVLLADIGHPQAAVPILADNEVAVKIANDKLKPRQASAMDMRYYYLQEQVNLKNISITWSPGKTNLADYFTKLLPPKEHRERRNLYVVDNYYSKIS
jgi:hypothetical protein